MIRFRREILAADISSRRNGEVPVDEVDNKLGNGRIVERKLRWSISIDRQTTYAGFRTFLC